MFTIRLHIDFNDTELILKDIYVTCSVFALFNAKSVHFLSVSNAPGTPLNYYFYPNIV